MKTMKLTQLRAAFWQAFPQFQRRGATQNDYKTDIRVTWCDFIEAARSNCEITDSLAQRATL